MAIRHGNLKFKIFSYNFVKSVTLKFTSKIKYKKMLFNIRKVYILKYLFGSIVNKKIKRVNRASSIIKGNIFIFQYYLSIQR